MLMGKYGRTPDRTDEALDKFTKHVTQFLKLYSKQMLMSGRGCKEHFFITAICLMRARASFL